MGHTGSTPYGYNACFDVEILLVPLASRAPSPGGPSRSSGAAGPPIVCIPYARLLSRVSVFQEKSPRKPSHSQGDVDERNDRYFYEMYLVHFNPEEHKRQKEYV